MIYLMVTPKQSMLMASSMRDSGLMERSVAEESSKSMTMKSQEFLRRISLLVQIGERQ